MGRKREPPPSPPPSLRALLAEFERTVVFDTPLMQKLAEGRKFFDQPEWRELREQMLNYQESETGRKLREIGEQLEQRKRQEIEAEERAPADQPASSTKPKRGGGRPPKLTEEQIEQGRAKLKTRPDLVKLIKLRQHKEALWWLRSELGLPDSTGDGVLRRCIIRPVTKLLT